MKKSTYLLIVGAILLIIVLNLLPSKEIPSLPINPTHKEYVSDEKCLECHGKEKAYPLPNKHPHEPENCKRCHIDKIYR